MLRLTRAVVLLSTVTSTAPIEAQRGDVRYGPWVTLGAGPAVADIDCSTCVEGNHTGASGFIEIGGTPSEHVTVGINGMGWRQPGADVSRSLLGVSAVLYYYTSVEQQSFFVKLGGATIRYSERSNLQRLTANGFALHVGAGYEITGPGHWHFAPHVTYIYSPSARSKRNLISLDDRLRLQMLSASIAVSWRR